METTGLSKYTSSFALSFAITSVVNALLVVVKEKSKGVMAGMKQITGHHWITHSAFIVILFVVLGLLLAKRGTPTPGSRVVATLLAGVVTGAAVIIGFYLIGD